MPDNLTRQQRSMTMSRIRSRDTGPELTVRRLVHARGLRFRKHRAELPGRPDLAFINARVAVFIDGDFWHGWGFAEWADNLAPYWRAKIIRNRERDARATSELEAMGWTVIRVWEHEIKVDTKRCIDIIEGAVRG
jgi:DNA mismatch endonuclease, patch repair protein